jgi:hypothetical protein
MAASRGHLHVLTWAVENGCSWDPIHIPVQELSEEEEAWVFAHSDFSTAVLAAIGEKSPSERCEVGKEEAEKTNQRSSSEEMDLKRCDKIPPEYCQGSLPIILSAMRGSPANAHLQARAGHLLSSFAAKKRNQSHIQAAGGIEAIVAAMRTHPGAEEVQENGCGALSNLANNTDNEVHIQAAGGIEAIVAAMRTHPGAEEVQKNGCNALNNISYQNTENQQALLSLDAISLVISAIEAFPHYADLQLSCCGVLGNLANPGADTTKVRAAGGLRLVLTAMESHTEVENVQQNACEALRLILGGEAEKTENMRALALTLAALQQFAESSGVHQHGFGALAVLARECGLGKDVVKKGGGVALAAALRPKSGDEEEEEEEEEGEEEPKDAAWLEGPLEALDALLAAGALVKKDLGVLAEALQERLGELEGEVRVRAEGLLARMRK